MDRHRRTIKTGPFHGNYPNESTRVNSGPWELRLFLVLTDRFACLTALAFGGLFVIAMALEFACKPLPLTEAFEAFEHLLNRLVPARSNLYHFDS